MPVSSSAAAAAASGVFLLRVVAVIQVVDEPLWPLHPRVGYSRENSLKISKRKRGGPAEPKGRHAPTRIFIPMGSTTSYSTKI